MAKQWLGLREGLVGATPSWLEIVQPNQTCQIMSSYAIMWLHLACGKSVDYGS